MASISIDYLKELVGKLNEGTELAKTIRILAANNIPLEKAVEAGVTEALETMAGNSVLKETVDRILEDLKTKKEAEQKEKRNAQARARYQKRKATEGGMENSAKRAKVDKENEGQKKKVPAPKKAPIAPLWKKSMKQAQFMGSQRR